MCYDLQLPLFCSIKSPKSEQNEVQSVISLNDNELHEITFEFEPNVALIYTMRVYKLLMLLAVMLLCIPSYGQSAKLNKANKLFDKFSYPEAAEAYKKILANRDVDEAKLKLAECYRKMNMPVEAEYWYEQVIDLPISDDINKLWYGLALKSNGKCELAKDVFLEYAQLVPADSRGLRLVESCDKEDYFRQDPGIYQIVNLPINSSSSDFAPAYYDDGLVFSSSRGGKNQFKEYNWTGENFLDLFYTQMSDPSNPEALSDPKVFKGKHNSWMHEGTAAFSKDGNLMFFTRNNYIKGKQGYDNNNQVNLKIFQARKEGEKWVDVVPLPFNSDFYSVGHPTLSEDAKTLYFTSDMPGGYGGTDIYVSFREGNNWSAPENLGPEINTEGKEMFPFIHSDGTLYFSSDALPGLGGLDVFSSKKSKNVWSRPENLRAFINSNFDDLGFIINDTKETGYFTSNRPGGMGDDDIYGFNRTAYRINGVIVNSKTQEPLSGVLVALYEDDQSLQEVRTEDDGTFNFPVNANKTYRVLATKSNFKDGEQPADTRDIAGSLIEMKVPLSPIIETSPCTLSGVVFNRASDEPVSGATVKLINRTDKTEKVATTMGDGTYTFPLDGGTSYTLFTTNNLFFTSTKEVSTKDRDCNSPIANKMSLDISMNEIEVNEDAPVKVAEEVLNLVHIYYDTDKSNIRPDAARELDKVVKVLYENPGIIMELGSHTDSRGTDSYNLSLSQSRAESAVAYIRSKGIGANRITAKGYGETALLNRCSNGVNCKEEEHQQNRRTEFRITGYEKGAAVYSEPRYYGTSQSNMVDVSKPSGNQRPTSTTTRPPVSTNKPQYTDNGYTKKTDSKLFNPPAPPKDPPRINTGTISWDDDETTTTTKPSSPPSKVVYTPPTKPNKPIASSNSSTTESAEVEFKIQIGAFKNPNLERYSGLSDLGFVDVEFASNDVKRIVLGTFSDRIGAESILNTVKTRGFRDAYIVRYVRGNRVN